MTQFTVYFCNVFEGIQKIRESYGKESIDCVITSPPYWGLRSYLPNDSPLKKSEIGLEDHPKKYINKIAKVFSEVRKVLKPTGSVWLNIGDVYYGGGGGGNQWSEQIKKNKEYERATKFSYDYRRKFKSNWLQRKQKLLIPHRIAIAMQEDGWILRNDVVWYKPNHMPSSVRDRLTNSFEYVFHFVKKKKYYYDLDAIREPYKVCGVTDKRPMGILRQKLYPKSTYNQSNDTHLSQYKGKFTGMKEKTELYGSPRARTQRQCYKTETTVTPLGKNPGDFWTISPQPYKEAHFACFPLKLLEKPLKATCPKWVCIKCGKPKERLSPNKIYVNTRPGKNTGKGKSGSQEDPNKSLHASPISACRQKILYLLQDFASTCNCNAGFEPGTVLDPFLGSGTTLQAAQELGLKGIGIELNPEYASMILRRLRCRKKTAPNTWSNAKNSIKFVCSKEIEYKPMQKALGEKQKKITVFSQ